LAFFDSLIGHVGAEAPTALNNRLILICILRKTVLHDGGIFPKNGNSISNLPRFTPDARQKKPPHANNACGGETVEKFSELSYASENFAAAAAKSSKSVTQADILRRSDALHAGLR
jgi:hypothetical protein